MAKGGNGGRTTELAFVNMGTAERLKLRVNMVFLTQIERAYPAFVKKWEDAGLPCPVESRGRFMQLLMAVGLDKGGQQVYLLPPEAKPLHLAIVNTATATRVNGRLNMNFLAQIKLAYEAFREKWSVDGIPCPVGSIGEFMQWLMAVGLRVLDRQFKLLPPKAKSKKR